RSGREPESWPRRCGREHVRADTSVHAPVRGLREVARRAQLLRLPARAAGVDTAGSDCLYSARAGESAERRCPMQYTQLRADSATDPFDGDPFDDESFFLSDTNLTATVDQRDMETLALELMRHPLVQEGREVAMGRFRILGGKHGSNAPEEALEGIEAKMD